MQYLKNAFLLLSVFASLSVQALSVNSSLISSSEHKSDASPAAANSSPANDGGPIHLKQRCASPEPAPEFRQLAAYFGHQERRDIRLGRRDWFPSDAPTRLVNLVIHIVETSASAGTVTDDMIANQAALLNTTYYNMTFAFNLIATTHSVNDTWANGQDDAGMKQALRQGNYSTINLYFQSDLAEEGSPGQTTLGFCTMPTYGITTQTDPSAYVTDGCNVLASTMPGGAYEWYNLGMSAVHETGHWLGLMHVFQDNTCDSSDPGDYIADTPQQSIASSGCPVSQDSCPNSPGDDAVHNYMDYSQDSCYEGFSFGQRQRMIGMFDYLRKGR